MTALAVLNPIPQFFERDGDPLDAGFLTFGLPNQNPVTAPVTAYWDAAATIPAAQPIRTINGYPSRGGTPAIIYIDQDFSLMVQDKRGRLIYYAENSADFGNSTSVLNAIALLQASLANVVDVAKGAGLVGFDWSLYYAINTAGWGIQTAGNSYELMRDIPVAEWAAIYAGTSTYDVTAIVTAAIANRRDVFARPGVYSVDPDIGVRLVGSMRLRGAGQNRTIFKATAQGATVAELTNYTKGSVFKRAYTPGVANARIDTVHLSDFAIVLNHPTASVTTTEIQIGLDLRHIGRTVVERVWVGNIAPLGGLMVKADPGAYAAQGYGIVIGNVDTGNAGYCGGEVHRISNCSVYGAYKLIVQDDLTLSPLSGAHAVNIVGCDLQGGHSLLAQEQQYTAGCVWDGNTIQDVRRKPGDASATYVLRIAGFDNEVRPCYIEAGVADYLLRFDSASDNNRVALTHYGATTIGIAAFSDTGRRNRVACRNNTGTYPAGVDSKGTPVVRYDRSFEEMSITCHYDGVSAMVKDAGLNLTVTRPTGAGDYLFTYGLPIIDANAISLEVSYDTNASGHGGTHAVISKGTTNLRIQFYAQNGGTSTAIDPRFVFVKVKQVVTA